MNETAKGDGRLSVGWLGTLDPHTPAAGVQGSPAAAATGSTATDGTNSRTSDEQFPATTTTTPCRDRGRWTIKNREPITPRRDRPEPPMIAPRSGVP